MNSTPGTCRSKVCHPCRTPSQGSNPHTKLGFLVLWQGASVLQRQGNILFNDQFGLAIRSLWRRCLCHFGWRFSHDVC